MMLLTCRAVQQRLSAFYDRELPIPEQIAVESHVYGCPPCARELRSLQNVGRALREGSAPGPADDWTGLQPGVIGRMRAEAHQSWPARASRFLDDLHLVWIGLAATVATFLCGALALSALHYGGDSRDDGADRFESQSRASGRASRSQVFAARRLHQHAECPERRGDGGDAVDAGIG